LIALPPKEDVTGSVKLGITGSQLPVALIGVKACDLAALGILDRVFLEEPFSDPFYAEKRKNNLIISADCTYTQDTCFCTALGRNPYSENSFDINLSVVTDGFIVEIGTDKGRTLVEQIKSSFSEISEDDKNKRNKDRETIVSQVEKNIEKYKIPHCRNYESIIKDSFDSQLWKDEASTCVECGACNFICPTCHCFQLKDVLINERNERFKLWDACLYKRFAEVAGGANPRPNLWMRLRNRYDKKFDYFPEVSGEYACTGCGRCILCCPAKIDIRRILKNLVSKSTTTHPA